MSVGCQTISIVPDNFRDKVKDAIGDRIEGHGISSVYTGNQIESVHFQKGAPAALCILTPAFLLLVEAYNQQEVIGAGSDWKLLKECNIAS